MEEQQVEALAQESFRQLKMREGLENISIEFSDFAEVLAGLVIPKKAIHPLIELSFNHHKYVAERKRVIDNSYVLGLRAVIMNCLVGDEKKEEFKKIDRDRIAAKYMARKGGSFVSNWEYHLLVYHKPGMRALLDRLAQETNPLSLLFCINHKRLIGQKSIYESRRPAIVAPGATDKEIKEIIMQTESERNANPGYLGRELPYKHYDRRRKRCKGIF